MATAATRRPPPAPTPTTTPTTARPLWTRSAGPAPGSPRAPHPPADVPATGWVKVTTVTPDDDKVDFVFAPILGHDSGTVDATAVAAWGAVGRATTLPLTFSECEFIELGGNVDAGTFPSGLGYIYVHDTTAAGSCPAGPSGAEPSRRLRLARQPDECGVDVTADSWVSDKPGNGVPQRLRAGRLAVCRGAGPASSTTSNGLNGSTGELPHYRLRRHSACPVTGSPETRGTTAAPAARRPDRRQSGTYICGEFTRVVTTTGRIGTGPDYGAHVVQMIG